MSIGNKNWVKCKFNDCYKCCLETEMLLTSADIQNIEKVGYDPKDFIFENSDGFFQLHNIDSILGKKCFFLNDKGKCTLVKNKQDNRPQGCKIYPLIVDLNDNTIRIDDDCRENNWFSNQSFLKGQIDTISGLVEQLLDENKNN